VAPVTAASQRNDCEAEDRTTKSRGRGSPLSYGLVLLIWATGVRPVWAEWTAGAFLGGARTQESSIRLIRTAEATDVTLSPVRYRSESFDPPIYYGYRLGFFPRAGWLGVEAEFIHLKVTAETSRSATMGGTVRGARVDGTQPLTAVLERFSISHGVNLVFVNAVVRRVARTSDTPPRWFLAGRVGAGPSVPHPESTIGGASFEGYEWGSWGVQAAGGAELRVVKRVYVTAEYKLTRTVQDVAVVGGAARTPLTTHHLVAGLVAHLGAFSR
jgi:hypothetical protein